MINAFIFLGFEFAFHKNENQVPVADDLIWNQ